MRYFRLVLILLLLWSGFMLAQQAQGPFDEYGEVLKAQLSSAPFPHARRAAGHSYGKEFFSAEEHYADSSVACFIPRGFRPTDSVDLIIHIHGWWNNIDTVLRRYLLPQQVAESGKNAILVVPEGPRNAPDSFGGKLEDQDGLKRFVGDVVDFLYAQGRIKTRALGKLILAGHSGAYHAISYALLQGGITEHIREVYLFDALYGQVEKYTHWIDHYNGKMVVMYTDSGGTKDETEGLMEDLRAWNIPYFAAEETSASPADVSNHRLIFLHTDLSHDMVLHGRMEFREFLKASCLSNR